MKLTETCRADGKSIKEDYYKKYLLILIFVWNLSLLTVKILRGYNQKIWYL